MRSTSIKAVALALTLAATLSTAPAYAAARQNHDRETGRVSRLFEKVMRFIGDAFDGIVVPHP